MGRFLGQGVFAVGMAALVLAPTASGGGSTAGAAGVTVTTRGTSTTTTGSSATTQGTQPPGTPSGTPPTLTVTPSTNLVTGQVVSVSGRGVDAKFNSGRLKVKLDEMLKQVRVASKVLEGSTPGLEEVVAGALSKAGFLIDTGESPVFLLKASLKLSDLGIIDGWYWQRGNLEISVSEAATGRVRGTQRWPIKSSARDRATAVRRALDEADTVLKSELGATIIGMATSTK